VGRLRPALFAAIGLALLVGVLVGGWTHLRGSAFGSRSPVFGGRGLDGGAVGDVAVTVSGDGGFSLMLASGPDDGDDLLPLAEGLPGQSVPGWSPDGSHVAHTVRVGAADDGVDRYALRVVPAERAGDAPALGSARAVDLAVGSADVNQMARPVWSPDGSQVAVIANLPGPGDELGTTISSVWVGPATGGELGRIGPDVLERQECHELIRAGRCTTDTTGDARQIAWRADGRAVFAVTEIMGTTVTGDVPDAPRETPDRSRVVALPLDAGPPQPMAEVEGPLDQLATSPDGRFLLFGSGTAEARVVDLTTGEDRVLGTEVTAPSWSADGAGLVYVDDGQVMAADADGTGRDDLTRIVYNPESTPIGISPTRAVWSPDRRHLAVAGDGGLYLMNADGTGRPASPTWMARSMP